MNPSPSHHSSTKRKRPIRFLPAKPLRPHYPHKGLFISSSSNEKQQNHKSTTATRNSDSALLWYDIHSSPSDKKSPIENWKWSCCGLPHHHTACPAHRTQKEVARFDRLVKGCYVGHIGIHEWRLRIESAEKASWNLFILKANDAQQLKSIQFRGVIPQIQSHEFVLEVSSVRSVRRQQLSFHELLKYSLFDTPEMVHKRNLNASGNTRGGNATINPSNHRILCQVDSRGKYIRFAPHDLGVDVEAAFREENHVPSLVRFKSTASLQEAEETMKNHGGASNRGRPSEEFMILRKIEEDYGNQIMSRNELYCINDWSAG